MRRESDDPSEAVRVAPNMTPMIDVTFQLIIVFLCSMKFRTLDMKLESDLAREGMDPRKVRQEIIPRVRVRLKRAGPGDPTQVLVQDDRIGSTAGGDGVWLDLEGRVRAMAALDGRLRGEIDASGEVPHGDVIRCLDAFRGAGLEDVRFRGTKPRN